MVSLIHANIKFIKRTPLGWAYVALLEGLSYRHLHQWIDYSSQLLIHPTVATLRSVVVGEKVRVLLHPLLKVSNIIWVVDVDSKLRWLDHENVLKWEEVVLVELKVPKVDFWNSCISHLHVCVTRIVGEHRTYTWSGYDSVLEIRIHSWLVVPHI